MNFEYYCKIQQLPLKSTLKAVYLNLAFHSNPNADNLCIPSYDTIQSETGVSRSVISKALKIGKEAGIIDYKHRAQIGTGKKDGGKEANQYFIILEGYKLYKSRGEWKLSKDEYEKAKQRIKDATAKVALEDNAKGKKSRSAFKPKPDTVSPDIRTHREPPISPDSELYDKSSYMDYPISPDSKTYRKSQKSINELRSTKGSTASTISPHSELVSPHIHTRSIKESLRSSQARKEVDSKDLKKAPDVDLELLDEMVNKVDLFPAKKVKDDSLDELKPDLDEWVTL